MTSVTLPSSSGPMHGSGYASNVNVTAVTATDPAAAAAATTNIVDKSTFERPRPVKRCHQASNSNQVFSDSYKKRRKQATPVRISAADSDCPELVAVAATAATATDATITTSDDEQGGAASATAPESTITATPTNIDSNLACNILSTNESTLQLTPAPISPEPTTQSISPTCPICDVTFPSADILASHMSVEHGTLEMKKEIEELVTGSEVAGTDRLELPNALQLKNGSVPVSNASTSDSLPWISDLSNRDWINPSLMPFATTPTNPMFLALPFAQPSEAIAPRQPIRIFNPDAYCELCNKEFCNKYFLKTHKANKHGIYTDPPSTDINISASVSIPSYVNNKLSTTPVPTIEPISIKSEPKVLSTLVSPYPDLYQSSFVSKMCSTIIKPPFASSTSIPNHYDSEQSDTATPFSITTDNVSNGDAERCHGRDDPSDESSSPKVQIESTSVKNEISGSGPLSNTISYTAPSKHSPGQQLREIEFNNRLRRIGVMNPKAFCEICCKEYCNKYFLRTHKMKRHGIFIPDEKDKDSKYDSLMQWSQNTTQTSPLNLIMGEQSNLSDRKTSSPSNIRCDLCGIKFQNASLMQLHNLSVHGKITQDYGEFSSTDDKRSSENDKSINVADNISEDLQKLQSMILQLNDLEVNTISSNCNVCNKEFENRYYLHAHMMTEHGLILDEHNDHDKNQEGDAIINNNSICDLCGKDFQNFDELKLHVMEMHASNQSSVEVKDEFNGFTIPDKNVQRTASAGNSIGEKRVSMSLTPTSSYCEICNKELCNKYFMKTHMQRMHGIEIENGAQIGGVICDICNKELCSKYFLRVHKHNTHGIVEYGASLLQPRIKNEEFVPTVTPDTDQALKPVDLADLSHRYFTHFTEVCTICSRRFRSTKWLKTHLMSDHGQAGADKWAEIEQQLQNTMKNTSKKPTQGDRISPALHIPSSSNVVENTHKLGIQNVLSSIFGADESNSKMYYCSYCPFSTPLLPFLFVHERSHTLQQNMDVDTNSNASLKCPVCNQIFSQAELLQHHMFTAHPFLPLPPFYSSTADPLPTLTTGTGETSGTACTSKEPSECADETEEPPHQQQQQQQVPRPQSTNSKIKQKSRKKLQRPELLSVPLETEQNLIDIAKKTNLPATYALPQLDNISSQNPSLSDGDEGGSGANKSHAGNVGNSVGAISKPQSPSSYPYVMQAFLLEEASPCPSTENRVVSSIVFLPVLQKVSAPLTATFTLTPA